MKFQDIILTLQRYWAERGCAVVQPWDVEKGAGTFNAATYLRSLGPEPWSVAYVEPSRRPTDGRYGENPNRLERHHQFQVLLKPSPKDIQEMYLGSLRALGIDPFEHDIRFVEDNWESPTLGAWGLGWEVWCDGMEVTQFTYFQQCGGYDLEPIAVELTYGLERLAMALQNVDNVYNLAWVGDVTYGEMRHAEEVQWSKHNFEAASVEKHLRWFDEFKEECLRLSDAGLVIPAYDYCLKTSHVFNILDARGAIGVTERQQYILRVRELAKRCADSYLEHRRELGFPLRRHERPREAIAVAEWSGGEPSGTHGQLLLELGCEEIPARLAPAAALELRSLVLALLDELGLTGTPLLADSTPRRLVLAIDGVPLRQSDRVELVKGPPVKVAYDAAGAATRAGQSFLDKVQPGDEVTREAIDGPAKGEYLILRRPVSGRLVRDLLAERLPGVLGKLHWPKPMRWGYEPQPFVRPIHWIVCALDEERVPFVFAGVSTGLESRGHRFHAPHAFLARSLAELEFGLEERHVLIRSDARRARILERSRALAAEAGGTLVEEAALVEELTHIVEWPVPMLARFEAELLDLPRQAVVTPMRVHQRYFPVEGADGQLLPCFVAVGNTEVRDPAAVVHGYARVLRARLADARYFFENDLKKPLETLLPRLETRIWLAQVGSVREKVDRIIGLLGKLSAGAQAERAALLSKSDLATEMVGEFPELQGEMGREYARRHGEEPEVAEALFEAYLPRFAGDVLPATLTGTWVALADRIDSLVGCFAAGLKPTGSKDPYALRRQSLGIIQMLAFTPHDVPRDLTTWIDAALSVYASASRVKVRPETRAELLEFVADRTRFYWRERLPSDVVDAVVAVGASNPLSVKQRIETLAALRDRGELEPILTTFKRVANISKDVTATVLPSYPLADASLAERELFAGLPQGRASALLQTGDVDGVASLMADFRPLVDRFFTDVLVMCDDLTVREARLHLLAAIRSEFAEIADFARIQDRK